MVEQISFSPQVKRSVVISNKLVYTSCPRTCRTTQDLRRPYKIRKYQENVKTSQNYGLVLSLPPEMKILLALADIFCKQKLNFSRSALFHMKSIYFVNDFLGRSFFLLTRPQTPSNLICLTTFVTLRPLTQFQLKIRATNLEKRAKACLTQ